MNVPVKSYQDLQDERVNFIHLILEALGEGREPGAQCGSRSLPPHAPLLLGPRHECAAGLGAQPRL